MKGTDVIRFLVRRLLEAVAFVTLLTLFSLSLLSAPALADDQVVVDESFHQVQVLSVLVGTVLPILVGLITKRVTSESTKSLLLAFFSAAAAFVTEAINAGGFGDGFSWEAAALTAVITFVTAVAVHFGLWKPTGVAGKAQASLVK